MAVKIFGHQYYKKLHQQNPHMFYKNHIINASYLSKLWGNINKCAHTNQLVGYCTRKNAIIINKFRSSFKSIKSLFCNILHLLLIYIQDIKFCSYLHSKKSLVSNLLKTSVNPNKRDHLGLLYGAPRQDCQNLETVPIVCKYFNQKEKFK